MSREVQALYITAIVTGVLQAAERGNRVQAALAAATPVETFHLKRSPKIPPRNTIFSHGEHMRASGHNPEGTGRGRIAHKARHTFRHRSSRHNAV